MLDYNKFVPRTNDRYILNVFGDIIDCNLGMVVSATVDGVKTVEMDWYVGVKRYEVGLVVIVASLGLNIPSSRWDEVVVHYRDSDKTNTAASNIYYTFKKPIEAIGFPGFHYVPTFTRYAIDANGVLVNVERGSRKTWHTVKPIPAKGIRGGYQVTQASTDRNERTNMSRHRAMALTYIPCPGDPREMLVNHLDGVGGSDEISNLEWTTHSGNVTHAYATGLYSNKVRAILVKDAQTEVVTRFNTVAECALHFKTSHATLTGRVKRNPGKYYSNGYAYKGDDDSPWINEVVKERLTKEIIFRNVFSDETVLVNNQREASDLSGVNVKKIWYHLSKDSEVPLNGFIFRYFNEDGNEWPRYSKDQLEEIKQSCYIHTVPLTSNGQVQRH